MKLSKPFYDIERAQICVTSINKDIILISSFKETMAELLLLSITVLH